MRQQSFLLSLTSNYVRRGHTLPPAEKAGRIVKKERAGGSWSKLQSKPLGKLQPNRKNSTPHFCLASVPSPSDEKDRFQKNWSIVSLTLELVLNLFGQRFDDGSASSFSMTSPGKAVPTGRESNALQVITAAQRPAHELVS